MAKQKSNSVNKWLIAGGVIAVLVILLILSFVGMYNTLVSKDVFVEKAWGNVQASYQRRADLIPNLVDTVKGSRDFEQQTQTQIAQLRSEAGTASSKVQSAQSPNELQQAGGELSSVLSRLLVIVEAYPDLKSNQNFLALQDELAGTENRIVFERNNFNGAVADYKRAVRSFPTNIIAGMFGFSVDKHQTFQADSAAQTVPDVSFT